MSETLKLKIGRTVRAARERLEITQEELAGRVDRQIDSISLIERGKTLPPLLTLLALSKELGVPLSDFVGARQGDETKTHKRLATEAQIAEVLRGLSDSQLEFALEQLAIIAKHIPPARKRK